ncbi:MAG: TIGR00730 family Rossman fold protein [Solirubrobacteraceae bacterium]
MASRRVCVYAGSTAGARPQYADAARALARVLCARRRGIVFGGSRAGLMGALADEALARGGEVIGVIPRYLVEREVAHQSLTDLHVVATMHERKALMAELADAFVALPGGIGTLEELVEMLTWAQLGLHAKPIGIVNVDGYYDGLLAFLQHAVGEGFLSPATRELLTVRSDPEALLDELDRRAGTGSIDALTVQH